MSPPRIERERWRIMPRPKLQTCFHSALSRLILFLFGAVTGTPLVRAQIQNLELSRKLLIYYSTGQFISNQHLNHVSRIAKPAATQNVLEISRMAALSPSG